MSDRSLELEVPLIFFLILSWITVSLRCYVRIYMVKNFAIDDYFILAALLTFTIFCGLAIASVSWGTGKHMADLTIQQQWNAMKTWHFCEFFYPISTTCLRLSAGFFLLRISVKKTHRYIIHTLNVANVLIGFYLWFVNIFQCKPVDYWWTRVDGKHVGECNLLLSANTIYVQSAVTAVIDWTFGLLPIFIIWDLQMNRGKKIIVGFILSLAAIASTATIIRLPYVYELVHTEDFLWASIPVALWSSVEPGLGLVALSLATLRPLFRSCLIRLGLTDPDPTLPGGGFNTKRAGSSTQRHYAQPNLGNGYVTFDKEMQLEGMTRQMGNESLVEAGQRRGKIEHGLGKGDSFRLKNGANWATRKRPEDDRMSTDKTSDDEIAVTKTMRVTTTWSPSD